MLATPSLQDLVNEIHRYIVDCGGIPSEWYVGIANHTDRLFVDHGVHRQSDAWIFRRCVSSPAARVIEKAFLDWGCDGGGGGGGYDTVIVYAYRKTRLTTP